MRVFVAALCLLVSCFAAQAEQTLLARVDRVIDADTFDVTVTIDFGVSQMHFPRTRIRLACVNAPENSTAEGKRLTKIVDDILTGRDVLLHVEGDGGFSRVLASVRPVGWSETLEGWLYRLPDPVTPLYTGSQTTVAEIQTCRARLEAEVQLGAN